MKNAFTNKTVFINEKTVITDWRRAKIISPENLQDKTSANELAKKEIEKQTEFTPTSSNSISIYL